MEVPAAAARVMQSHSAVQAAPVHRDKVMLVVQAVTLVILRNTTVVQEEVRVQSEKVHLLAVLALQVRQVVVVQHLALVGLLLSTLAVAVVV
jgi:hypothetical protein